MKNFLTGLTAGGVASGIIYVFIQTPPWWWVVGLTIAVLVWVGKFIWDMVIDAINLLE